MNQTISIIIPVCNERGNLPVLIDAIKQVMQPLPYNYTYVFVEDSSTDGTLDYIKQMALQQKNILFIALTRSFGHQNAIKAAIDKIDADAVIMMDGDMQHPPTLLPKLIDLWQQGNDIVYTIRKEQQNLPFIKRKTSSIFYKLINRLSDIEIEDGSADFRLIDRKVAVAFKNFTEDDLFWRGLVKWLGYKQIGIEYEPAERVIGSSKYTYKRLMQLALKGITSFSVKPLSIAVYLGFTFSLLSTLYIPYVLFSLLFEHPISGWASMIVTIAFFGGLQLMILGIIGMYLGKLFMQSKHRPHYIIKESNL